MKKQVLRLTIFVLVMLLLFNVHLYAEADSYWKIISWELRQGDLDDFPTKAILVPQDGYVTEPGYGWCEATAPEIHVMIDLNDNHSNFLEVLEYKGKDSNGIPVIHGQYIPDLVSNPLRLSSTPIPPCFNYTPSAYTLNGSSSGNLSVNALEPLILCTPVSSANDTYFISVQLSDASGNAYGTEAMEWLTHSTYPAYPYYFDKYGYDIQIFCKVKNFKMLPGNYYRIRMAVSPWDVTTKLVYVKNLKDSTSDLVPIMTSNTSPSGIASASSIFDTTSTYDAWRAFDGNDTSATFSHWVSGNGSIPAWLSYEFTEPKYIIGYHILAEYTLSDRTPKEWSFQGWDGTAWVTLDTRTEVDKGFWTAAGLSFNIKNPGFYSKYRLYINKVNGSTVASIVQLKLLAPIDAIPVMTSNTSPSGIASSSSNFDTTQFSAWRAFDGNDTSEVWSRWISGSIPAWISYEFTSSNIISSYYILPEYGTSTKNRSPKSWTLEGWNGSSWVLLDVRKNITNDVDWTAKGLYFKIPANVNAPVRYIKYRLNITAVNGSSVVSIRQLKLFYKN
ncbi:MAG TPA: discoidin domain-containing protein [Bacillota bacterium]|nr:discoidin domain-containing protein [Bacillota bacterium]